MIMLYKFKLPHSTAEETHNIAKASGLESPSECTVKRWFKRFSSGDFKLEDKPVPVQRMSLNDQSLRSAFQSEPDAAIRQIEADIGVHSAAGSRHLASIGMAEDEGEVDTP